MKVLVCIPCLLTGGTEIQTLSLVEALVAAGHEPVVACYFEYAQTMVERYRDAGAEVALLSVDGTRPVGVRDTLMHLWRGLRRVVQQYRPHIAHVQYMAPGALPILVLRALGIKKIIATSHTAADIYPSLKQIHWLNRHILTAFQCITLRAEKSFFGSASLYGSGTNLVKHGNHFTIYNNLPSYISIADKPRAERPQIVGVVSRLERIKGMDLVVPAFAEAYAQYPQLKLLVVGDGSLRRSMERQVCELGIPPGAVEFVGRQEQDLLTSYYDRIDILLMPSRSEGFGLTAIEGMARGCVPVVANVGGLPEVVEDGKSGLIHQSGAVADIADKIAELMADTDHFLALSAGALHRAKCFTKEHYNQQIADLYSRIK